MKKVYILTKIVTAISLEEALILEKKAEVTEIKLADHSTNLLLDSLHSKIK